MACDKNAKYVEQTSGDEVGKVGRDGAMEGLAWHAKEPLKNIKPGKDMTRFVF